MPKAYDLRQLTFLKLTGRFSLSWSYDPYEYF